MREIWRKTAELFWERPILWVPVLCAEFITFWLAQINNLITTKLGYWFLWSPASVLSRALAPRGAGISWLVKDMLIMVPFLWCGRFLLACLYAAAFVMTAALVDGISSSGKADLSFALYSTTQGLRRILGLALEIFLYFLACALLCIPLGLVDGSIRAHGIPLFIVGYCEAFVFYMGMAYFFVPASMLLLRDASSRLLKRESSLWGYGFSVGAALAIFAISYFSSLAEKTLAVAPVFTEGIPQLFVELAVSLLIAFPYIPLFIALSLIEKRDAAESEVPTIASGK